jgi:hypothetical protein
MAPAPIHYARIIAEQMLGATGSLHAHANPVEPFAAHTGRLAARGTRHPSVADCLTPQELHPKAEVWYSNPGYSRHNLITQITELYFSDDSASQSPEIAA